ncbi:uncharacterized protein [Linepithema humile]|uniref:uncharacterized protein n=1 Tax=Linepithema humile TaxID=83485 RepID=UPI00351ED191
MAKEPNIKLAPEHKPKIRKSVAFIESEAAREAVKIEVRLSKIEEVWRKFEEVQEGIELLNLDERGDLIDEAVADRNANERAAFEEQYLELEANAQAKLRVAKAENDSFLSLIHNNRSLSAIQKFQYLRSSLKGEALQILNSLNTSVQNYDIEWELLVKRYENKRLIINTHTKELLEFPVVSKESTASLRTFIDHIRTHTRALRSLGQPVEQWDTLLIYLASTRLDYNTRRDWEVTISKREQQNMPTMEELLNYLGERCSTLEMLDKGKLKQELYKQATQKNIGSEKRVALVATSAEKCAFYEGDHFLYKCEEFLKLSETKRREEVMQRGLCLNCLRKGHLAKTCKSTRCRNCSKSHNTLLHVESRQPSSQPEGTSKTQSVGLHSACRSIMEVAENKQQTTLKSEGSLINAGETAMATYCSRKSISHVMLSTAQVYVCDVYGNQKRSRVLLDPGSQSNLVTSSLIRLKLSTTKENVPISGINRSQTRVQQSARIKLKSMYNNFSTTLDCLILPTITEKIPQIKLNAILNLPEDGQLADPAYGTPGEIDLLIRAGLFWSLMRMGHIKQEKDQPTLIETQLGWILGGEIINSQGIPA